MRALIATLLPEPVVPAIRRCGIAAQVVHDRLPVDVLAERERQQRRGALELLRLDDVAQRDDLAAAGIGDLDADARAAGQPLDPDRLGREREREVLGEAHDLVDLDPRGRPELVGRDDGPRVVLRDLPLDAELRALGRDDAPGLGQEPPCPRCPVAFPLLEERDLRVRVALHREGQPLLWTRPFFLGGAAAPDAAGGSAAGGATVVFVIENRPGPGTSRRDREAPPRARKGPPRARSLPCFAFSRCLATTVRRRRSLVRRSRWRAQPTVSRPRRPASRTRKPEKTSPSETWVANGTPSRTSVPSEQDRARRPEPRAGRVAEGAPARASRLHLLAEDRAASRGQRDERRDGQEEKAESGRLRAGVGERPLPETPPSPEGEEHRHRQAARPRRA